MDWNHYDQQEDKEPFDAILEAKESVKPADQGRYKREEKVQGYLRMVKMSAGSSQSPRDWLLNFVSQSSAPDADYCRARLGGKISPLLRWHYYLALYFADKGDWLAKAIPLILESAERAGGGGDSRRSSSYLLLAHNLNRWHNCEMDSIVLESALRYIRGRRGDAYAHWCSKIVADLEEQPDVRDKVRDLLLAMAGEAKPDTAYLYLKAAIDVAGDKAPARAAWVDFHERRGDEVQSPLSKMSCYYDAKRHLDDKEGLRRINAKIKEAQKHVELDKFTHEWKAPKIDICGATGFDRVSHLVEILRSSIPSVEAARATEKEMRERFPIQHLFQRINIGSDGVPGPGPRAAGPDAAADHTGQFASTIQFLRAILSAAAREHEDDGRIREANYEGYLETFGLLPDAAKRLAGAGIRAHCSGDYIASVHILIPQVEQALRLLLEQKGVPTLGGKNRARQDLLKRMIAEGEGVLGRDLAEFLRVWLIDEGATNLRNRVCHALYADYSNMDGYDPLGELDHGTSLLLVLAICLLVGMSVDSAGARARGWRGDRTAIEGDIANCKGVPGNVA